MSNNNYCGQIVTIKSKFSVAPSCCIPQPILHSVSASSLTVTWDREPCLSCNGANSHYEARYMLTGSSIILESWNVTINNRNFTASSLSARTSYTFEVAFVNEVGSGPYTTLIINTTLPCMFFIYLFIYCLYDTLSH